MQWKNAFLNALYKSRKIIRFDPSAESTINVRSPIIIEKNRFSPYFGIQASHLEYYFNIIVNCTYSVPFNKLFFLASSLYNKVHIHVSECYFILILVWHLHCKKY